MYEDVLAEVKAEGAKKAAEHGEVLPFSEIPYERTEGATADTLWKWFATRTSDVEIPPVITYDTGNPVKKVYSKIVSKVTRCVTFPMTKNMTGALRDCLDATASVIEDQQKEIRELRERIARLEAEKEGKKE